MIEILEIAVTAIFIWELAKAIVKLIWREVTSPREVSYGPTHQAYREWKKTLKKRNG